MITRRRTDRNVCPTTARKCQSYFAREEVLERLISTNTVLGVAGFVF
jgi:hypothetical protein